jgi:ABC-2 type transport system ATP-binding protein
VNVIEVQGLTKDYRQHFWTPKRRVLNNVSFEVRQGEIFGFLGPNGAGKSTTIKILLQIIYPSRGQALVMGKPLGDRSAKKHLGFLPENPYFYDYLTAHQFLSFHGSLYGLDESVLKKRIPAVLEMVGMRGTDKLHLRSFSKGMLQRIGIAQAIIHDPELVILDEPMTGLDPLGRREVRDLMIELQSRGKTIFFSTHILSDVESICHRVAILNKGKLLSCGTLEDLISVEIKSADLVWASVPDGLTQVLKEASSHYSPGLETIFMKMSRRESESSQGFQLRVQSIVQRCVSAGASLQMLSPKKESLEDVFVRQVGQMESRV